MRKKHDVVILASDKINFILRKRKVVQGIELRNPHLPGRHCVTELKLWPKTNFKSAKSYLQRYLC